MEEAADAFRNYVDALSVSEGVKAELKRRATVLGQAAIAQVGVDAQNILREALYDLGRGRSRP